MITTKRDNQNSGNNIKTKTTVKEFQKIRTKGRKKTNLGQYNNR